MSDISDIDDISSEYSEYLSDGKYDKYMQIEESSEESDIKSQNSEKQSLKEDYEEERYKKKKVYNNSLRKYQIDFDIKTIVAKKIQKIDDIEHLNYTLLVASIVILVKNGNKIDNNFPRLCNEIIETVIKCDMHIKDENNKIDQLKRDLLRYCRFTQLWIG